MTINLFMHSPTRATIGSSGEAWWLDFHDQGGGKFTVFCLEEAARATAEAFNKALGADEDDEA